MERHATVTEKTHPCKNQTRKDGAPDPKQKAKSEKRKAKSEKQIPHTARKGRERVPLEDRDKRDEKVAR